MEVYTLSNDAIRVTVLSKGATVHSLDVNVNGSWQSAVLSYESLSQYEHDPVYLNCLVGPHAGRIKDGVYRIGDKTIQLERNEMGNHHHGGRHSMRYLEFTGIQTESKLTLSAYDHYHQLDVSIIMVIDGSTLTIEYLCIPKEPQVLNLTHHFYFNLSDERTIKNHTLKTQAPYIQLLDKTCAATAETLAVDGTAFDFREKTRIGLRMDQGHQQFEYTRNIDHPFYTKDMTVNLESDVSKVGMRVSSTADYTVMYTSNYFDDSVLFARRGLGHQFEAIAIESQDLPNGVNITKTKDQIYSLDRPFKQQTRLEFYSI